MERKQITVGKKEGLGVGIIGIGLLMLFLPRAAQQIEDLHLANNTAYGIMLGATYVLALLIVLAGLAVIRLKLDDEETDVVSPAERHQVAPSDTVATAGSRTMTSTVVDDPAARAS